MVLGNPDPAYSPQAVVIWILDELSDPIYITDYKATSGSEPKACIIRIPDNLNFPIFVPLFISTELLFVLFSPSFAPLFSIENLHVAELSMIRPLSLSLDTAWSLTPIYT